MKILSLSEKYLKSVLRCVDCKRKITFPHIRGKMSTAAAKAIFVDSKGGRCVDCYLIHRRKETSELMARIRERDSKKVYIFS